MYWKFVPTKVWHIEPTHIVLSFAGQPGRMTKFNIQNAPSPKIGRPLASRLGLSPLSHLLPPPPTRAWSEKRLALNPRTHCLNIEDDAWADLRDGASGATVAEKAQFQIPQASSRSLLSCPWWTRPSWPRKVPPFALISISSYLPLDKFVMLILAYFFYYFFQ